MFKWNKIGKIFDPTEIVGKDWLNEFAQAPSTLILDDTLRVYFSCRSKKDDSGQFKSYSAFVDFDRNNLFKIKRIADKPVLELGKRGCFDEFGTYPISVLKRKDEIWAYYSGWTRCESVPFNTAIGFAKSIDNGESFLRIGAGPILSYSPEEPFIISGPKIRFFNDIYYLFYVSGNKWLIVDGKPEMSLKIRVASSIDGISWIKQNKNLIPENCDLNESQASPDVFFHDNVYHMFFCYWIPTSYRKTKQRKIGYAFSHNLVNWIRDDSKVGINVSSNGWDSEMLAYPHVFALDGNVYMLYLGNEVGRYGFGIAKLEGKF